MLATLNLKLSPVDLIDEPNLTPASPLPGNTSEVASGFSDLLRLGVDAARPMDENGGESLPQGGSELPFTTQLAAADTDLAALSGVEVGQGLIKLAAAPVAEQSQEVDAEAADVLLESPVIYPPPISEAGPHPQSIIATPFAAPVALSANPQSISESNGLNPNASSPEGASIDIRLRPTGSLAGGQALPIAAAVLDGRESRAQTAAATTVAPATAMLRMRGQGQAGDSATRTPSSTIANTLLGVENKEPPAGLAGRQELTSLQGLGGRADRGPDLLQPGINVAQATQAPQGQISPQPTQSMLSLAATSTAPTELTYGTAGQSNTDLIGIGVRDPAWGQQIGDRVVMMAANQLKQAELRLTPAELGPLRVQVSLEDGAAHVTFHAQHAVTREALEQAMPRLREMLAENGLSLGQADVSEHGVGEGGRERPTDAGDANQVTDDSEEVLVDSGVDPSRRLVPSNGLVDTFA